MKKLMVTSFLIGVFSPAFGQSLQSTDKGRELIKQMESSLESYYGHDMILTPSYEKGMKEYAYENANCPLPETAFEGNAHYHTAVHFSPELFEDIETASLVGLLTPDDDMDDQIKSMLETINPNRFYLESYHIKDEIYLVLGLDRPFDYSKWQAEE